MAIIFKNAKTLDGELSDYVVISDEKREIDCKGKLTVLPSVIDPHVHFRTPGGEYKEDFGSAAKAAIAGGITMVFDMPNNTPSCATEKELYAKKALIDAYLKKVGIPLRYELYFGADKRSLHEMDKIKKEVVGLKIYMGSSTGDLLMDEDAALDEAFRLAAQHDVLVAVHAEDEEVLALNKEKYKGIDDPALHSKIRSREAAILATKKAIALAEKYSNQLAILHVSTKEEVDLIREAKARGLLVFMEVSTHHLFLTEKEIERLGNRLKVNPPVREEEDRKALWEAIHDGTADFIGSDHAPHTKEEKAKNYEQAPSGVPGVDTLLPLLLNAHHEGKIRLEKIVHLTHFNIVQIFNLPRFLDVVLVDLTLTKTVTDEIVRTKCGWSPYTGLTLTGWPVYTVCQGKLFECSKM